MFLPTLEAEELDFELCSTELIVRKQRTSCAHWNWRVDIVNPSTWRVWTGFENDSSCT